MTKYLRYLQKMTLLLGLLFLVVCSFSQSAGVKVIPRPTNPYMAVNDFANVFSPSQRDILERKLRNFYDQTSNEIVILTLNSLDGFEVDDVTYAYVKNWKFGNKGKDNGILFFLSKEPRKIRIEVGKGLEGAIPDGMAGTILRREVIPMLKENDFFGAFDNGTSAIIQATKGEYKMDDLSDRRDSGSKGGSIWPIIAMIVVVFIVLAFINRRGGGGNGGMLTRRGYRRWGGPTIFDYGPWTGGGGGNWGSSGGGSSGGGGWGDFGGLGGGDFGGGGASGDW